MSEDKYSSLLTENKYAKILGTGDPDEKTVRVEFEKNKLSELNCNVYRFLNECGVRTAYVEPVDNGFIAEKCDMVELKVRVKREGPPFGMGRNGRTNASLYPQLRIDFHLRTDSNGQWREHKFMLQNPLVDFDCLEESGEVTGLVVYPSDVQMNFGDKLLTLTHFPFKWDQKVLSKLKEKSRNIFLLLERAWQLEGRRLVDMTLEFGFSPGRKLVLAGVISDDSWTLELDEYDSNDSSDSKINVMAETTSLFRLPKQRIILWTQEREDFDAGNNHDPFNVMTGKKALGGMIAHPVDCEVKYVTCSIAQKPLQAFKELQKHVHGLKGESASVCASTVIIALVSPEMGSILAANTTAPTVICPIKGSGHVYQSLEYINNVPVAIAPDVQSALKLALNILAMQSPRLFAILRGEIEDNMEGDYALF